MSIVDIIQTLGIVFTIVVAIIQMRFYVKAERISVITRISERNDALLNDIIAHHENIKDFSKPFDSKSTAYFGDPRVSIMYRILNFFDEMFFYYKQRLVSKQMWDLYQNTLKKFISNSFGNTFWQYARDEYNPDFQAVIDSIIAKINE
jgi:hypothetical protein